MKERPILFTGPMVRALIDGSKTQTRRIMKPQPVEIPGKPGKHWWPAKAFQSMMCIEDGCRQQGAEGMAADASPFGQHGDRLWVRETFYAYGRWVTQYSEKKRRDEWHFIDMTTECDRAYQYAASNPDVPLAKGRDVTPGWYTRPAIHMPRAASRILLEITGVRVERLRDISHNDAECEGVKCNYSALGFRDHYQSLWESINGAGSWDANPWVWCITFRRIAP